MKINILSDTIPWFGKYSGYDPLPRYFPDSMEIDYFCEKKNMQNKILGKFYQKIRNLPGSSTQIMNELNFARKIHKCNAAHILHLEGHINILDYAKNQPKNLAGTIHIPFNLWPESSLRALSKINTAIVLYNEDYRYFSQYIDKSKLHKILLGVDTAFFKPAINSSIKRNKVLFVGHYLRDFEMMEIVYNKITKQISNTIEFHFIIPKNFRNISSLNNISENNNVFFHANLSDEELLAHYQDSNVMLMPMNNSGANTAIVQAISVGLPVLTTNTGGIKSYGGGDAFEIIDEKDTDKMLEIFSKFYFESNYRNLISNNERRFALENLDWKIIVSKHLDVYSKLAN